jgi:hypothetical protein
MAAGYLASALGDGTFVWSDRSSTDRFGTTVANRFVIRAANGVGIGTNSPTTALHVRADSDTQHLLRVQNSDGLTGLYVTSNRGVTIGAVATPPERGLYVFGDVGIGTATPDRDLHVRQRSTSSSSIGLQIEATSGNNWAFYVATSDNLGFRYNDALMSRINASDGAYVQLSDAAFKTDVVQVEGVLDAFLQLRPSSYQMVGDPDGGRSTGLIAQEVQPLFPEVVSEQEGQLGISYSEMGVVTIAAVLELNERYEQRLAEQNVEIEALRAHIQALRAGNETLQADNEAVAGRLGHLERMMEMMASRD